MRVKFLNFFILSPVSKNFILLKINYNRNSVLRKGKTIFFIILFILDSRKKYVSKYNIKIII